MQPCLEYSSPGPVFHSLTCLPGSALKVSAFPWCLALLVWHLYPLTCGPCVETCHSLMRFCQGWCKAPLCSLSSCVLSGLDFHDRYFPVIVFFWHTGKGDRSPRQDIWILQWKVTGLYVAFKINHPISLFFLYVFLCVSAGAFELPCAYGAQQTTLGVSSHLQPCLRIFCLLFGKPG